MASSLSRSYEDSIRRDNEDPILRRALDSAIQAMPLGAIRSRSDAEISQAWRLGTRFLSGTPAQIEWISAVIAEVTRRKLTPWSDPSPTQAGGQLPRVPPYTILEKTTTVGVVIDVLVPSLRPTTVREKLEALLIAIASKEGADHAEFYSTREAFSANYDAVFSNRHPHALERGYLGAVENGTFRAPLR